MMLPPRPFDLVWDTLAPLLQLQEALQGLLDACASYLPCCVGGAVGFALLALTYLVLFELSDRTHHGHHLP